MSTEYVKIKVKKLIFPPQLGSLAIHHELNSIVDGPEVWHRHVKESASAVGLRPSVLGHTT